MTPIQSALIRAEKARAAMRSWDNVKFPTSADGAAAFANDEWEYGDAQATLANLVSKMLGVNVDRLMEALA